MDVRGWASDSVRNVRDDGIEGVRRSLWPAYRKVIEQGRHFQPAGDNIYDYDWDLLVVVDACRLDLMQEVAHKYEFVPAVDDHWSLDSTTALWMQRTFEQRKTDKTTYICSNPFSADRLDPARFADLQEVWEEVWADPGTVPPRAITNRTIEAMRTNPTERTIAHYLQPHCPFIPRPELSRGKDLATFGKQRHRDVWERYRDGDLAFEDLWEGYRLNLELVLDEIELLLENVEAENVVITSDHGNALGKWGIYGHPPRMPHQSLRTVPWVETTATDTGEYVPEYETDDSTSVDRTQQLESLGYL